MRPRFRKLWRSRSNGSKGSHDEAVPGPRIGEPELPDFLEGKGSPSLCFGLSEAQGPRESMEDRTTIIEDLRVEGAPPGERFAFVGVYDGHGGDEASVFVQQNLHLELGRALSERGDDVACEDDARRDAAVEKAILAAFERTDEKFIATSKIKTCGSCATTALFVGRHLYVANLGDSRTLVARGQRRGIVATVDHKPSRADESERIQRGGGIVLYRRVNGELAVSRAFGDAHLKMLNPGMLPPDAFAKNVGGGFDCGPPGLRDSSAASTASEDDIFGEEVYTEPLVLSRPEVTALGELTAGEDEFVLLACDGLFDVMSNDQVVAFVRDQLLLEVPPSSPLPPLVLQTPLPLRTPEPLQTAATIDTVAAAAAGKEAGGSGDGAGGSCGGGSRDSDGVGRAGGVGGVRVDEANSVSGGWLSDASTAATANAAAGGGGDGSGGGSGGCSSVAAATPSGRPAGGFFAAAGVRRRRSDSLGASPLSTSPSKAANAGSGGRGGGAGGGTAVATPGGRSTGGFFGAGGVLRRRSNSMGASPLAAAAMAAAAANAAAALALPTSATAAVWERPETASDGGAASAAGRARAQRVCEALSRRALEERTSDNVTVAVVLLQ